MDSGSENSFHLSLSHKERDKISLLIVEEGPQERASLKMALRAVGFNSVSEASSHTKGFRRLDERKFSHILFQARDSDIPSTAFLEKALKENSNVICIATSSQPTVDDVFSLLIQGAKGYLVTPYNVGSLEQAIIQATKGEALPEELLLAKDRNEALISITMTNLDRAATSLRQAKKFDSLKGKSGADLSKLRLAARMAHTFSEGGEEGFIDSLQEFAAKRSSQPASKLGRLRKRLNVARSK